MCFSWFPICKLKKQTTDSKNISSCSVKWFYSDSTFIDCPNHSEWWKIIRKKRNTDILHQCSPSSLIINIIENHQTNPNRCLMCHGTCLKIIKKNHPFFPDVHWKSSKNTIVNILKSPILCFQMCFYVNWLEWNIPIIFIQSVSSKKLKTIKIIKHHQTSSQTIPNETEIQWKSHMVIAHKQEWS